MQIAVVDSDIQQRARITEILRNAQYQCTPLSGLEKLISDGASEVELVVYRWQPTAKGNRSLLTLRHHRPDLPMLLLTNHSADHTLANV